MTSYGTRLPRREAPSRRPTVAAVVLFVILELTAATALIHLSLGGTLFTLNGLGYLGLAAAYLVSALLPASVGRPFRWLPRVALAGYAALTIGAYLVIGPYFMLGWVTKGIELAIIGLVAAHLMVD